MIVSNNRDEDTLDRTLFHVSELDELVLNMASDTDKFLAHHGIDGMKWGVQNGPPYPLSASDHKKVISKAKVKDAASKAGTAIKKASSATVKAAKKVRETAKAKKKEQEIRELTPKTFAENKSKYSDEEVARIANRLRMEQQINDLEKPTVTKGSNFVTDTLKTAAGNAFKDVATATATTAVERMLGNRQKDTGTMIVEEFSRMRNSMRKVNTADKETIKTQAAKITQLTDEINNLKKDKG